MRNLNYILSNVKRFLKELALLFLLSFFRDRTILLLRNGGRLLARTLRRLISRKTPKQLNLFCRLVKFARLLNRLHLSVRQSSKAPSPIIDSGAVLRLAKYIELLKIVSYTLIGWLGHFCYPGERSSEDCF